jgi:PHD/YefM family antitoxin component YafN of YafNO toxin-antitoxin module
MTTITASKTRIPRKLFAKVVNNGERVKITKYDEEVYLISKEDMELLQTIEDSVDIMLSDEVIERIRKGKENTIPWEEAKKELRL